MQHTQCILVLRPPSSSSTQGSNLGPSRVGGAPTDMAPMHQIRSHTRPLPLPSTLQVSATTTQVAAASMHSNVAVLRQSRLRACRTARVLNTKCGSSDTCTYPVTFTYPTADNSCVREQRRIVRFGIYKLESIMLSTESDLHGLQPQSRQVDNVASPATGVAQDVEA